MTTSIESYRKAVNSIDEGVYQEALNSVNSAVAGGVGAGIGGGVGAAVGGGVGAAVGSIVPAVGTALGAGIGAAVGSGVGTLFGNDEEASGDRKKIQVSIGKCQKKCDLLASIIYCNIEKDIDDSIEYIKQAKTLISKQEIDIKGSQDNPKTLILKELNQQLDNLKEIKTINKTFITKLRALGKQERLSPK